MHPCIPVAARRSLLLLKSIPVVARRSLPVLVNLEGRVVSIPVQNSDLSFNNFTWQGPVALNLKMAVNEKQKIITHDVSKVG
ncbi:hypothetical protein L1987_11822 [Smallanthus sonchifolius]|uniref:Uncharacterized protein n=1 Tax=Smallanthus sonchifolius TaxID=185202 RepID=A0ACB9JE52_9ASTR|nr:hypothetical protein L1987_11822 [Smallanthus sonchifolius]